MTTYQKYGDDLINKYPFANASTDLDAETSNIFRASAAGMKELSFKCYLKLNLTNIDFNEYEASWNKIKTDPILLVYESVGTWSITFPYYVIDLRGNKKIISFSGAIANPDYFNGDGSIFNVNTSNSGNVFTIYITAAGVLTDTVDKVDFVCF